MKSASVNAIDYFQVSTIQDLDSINPSHSSYSSSSEDPILQKFEEIQNRINLLKNLSEISSTPQGSPNQPQIINLSPFIQELITIKQAFDELKTDISDKANQNYIEDYKIEKLEYEVYRFDDKLEEAGAMCNELERKIKEADKVTGYFKDMFDGLAKVDIREDEYGMRHSRLEEMILALNSKKGNKKSYSPRLKTCSSNKLVIPKYAKTCRK